MYFFCLVILFFVLSLSHLVVLSPRHTQLSFLFHKKIHVKDMNPMIWTKVSQNLMIHGMKMNIWWWWYARETTHTRNKGKHYYDWLNKCQYIRQRTVRWIIWEWKWNFFFILLCLCEKGSLAISWMMVRFIKVNVMVIWHLD